MRFFKLFLLFFLAPVGACVFQQDALLKQKEFDFPVVDRRITTEQVEIFIDKEFSIYQTQSIEDAFRAWEVTLNGKVHFILNYGYPRPGVLKEVLRKGNGYNFFWSLSNTDDHNLTEEMVKQNYAGLNIRTENFQFLIVFKESSDDTYKIALHEIGHMLGLGHRDQFDISIMNPGIGLMPDCITKKDAENVCKIYDCEPRVNCDY